MGQNKGCPKCRESGHDSTGNHLWLMTDGKTWTCRRKEYHSDGEVYYEGEEGNPVNKFKDITSIHENFTGEHMLSTVLTDKDGTDVCPPTTGRVLVEVADEYRGIRPEVYKKYGVKGEYSFGSLVALGHELYESNTDAKVTNKIRVLPKTFFTEGKTKGKAIQFFGQSVFKRAKRILITEGELDAMSAYQMLEKYKVAVVSLPTGGNVKAFIDNFGYLKGFKEIYACTDQDKVGQTVSRDIANMVPSCKFMKISEKDANEMLQKGKQLEFISAFFDAEVYKPDTIVRVTDVIDMVMERPVMGEPWPWPTLTEKTYGRNNGQGMYVGAGVKIGKSEFINELVAFDVKRGKKIAVLKFEEPPVMTVKRVAGKIDKIFYHRPRTTYNDAQLRATAMSLHDSLYMYPAFGQATWESTKEFIRYCAMCGCQTIIIDPVTKLSNHLDSSATETLLRQLSDEIACMAQDMGFFYIITCHLKAPTSGPPHERGGKVQSYQFRGSRAMMECTHYLLGIERNKDPDLSKDEINTSTFVLLEDRNFGNSCKFPVFYNDVDQSYLEPTLKF